MKGPIRTAFCGIDTVCCVTGLPLDRVYNRIESGDYLWVWNVSVGRGAKRELRFWSREINDPASVANLTLNAVIRAVIPRRGHIPGQKDGLHNWELRHILRLSKPAICRLRAELGVQGGTRRLFIPRANVENFLRRRWLGNIHIPQENLQRFKDQKCQSLQ